MPESDWIGSSWNPETLQRSPVRRPLCVAPISPAWPLLPRRSRPSHLTQSREFFQGLTTFWPEKVSLSEPCHFVSPFIYFQLVSALFMILLTTNALGFVHVFFIHFLFTHRVPEQQYSSSISCSVLHFWRRSCQKNAASVRKVLSPAHDRATNTSSNCDQDYLRQNDQHGHERVENFQDLPSAFWRSFQKHPETKEIKWRR